MDLDKEELEYTKSLKKDTNLLNWIYKELLIGYNDKNPDLLHTKVRMILERINNDYNEK